MPAHQALSAHLEAAAPVIAASPFNLLAVVWNYIASLAGGLVDSPEDRDAIEAMIMGAYDKATLAAAGSNAVLGAAFALAKPTVKAAVHFMLAQFAPAPTPQPVPVPVIPQGSAGP